MIERVLVVGLGSIGKRHLRIARETLPAADIRVLRHQPCDSTPELANGCFGSIEDACAFAPQISVVANPAPMHIENAVALAGVGSHLLIEKPLSHTASDAQILLQDAYCRDIVLQVGYNLRFFPSLEKFRVLLQGGAIGRVLSVRCEIGQYLPSWRPDSDYRMGVSAHKELGGGVLLELSHELDYLRWLFGEVAWVNAYLGQQSALEIDVEDTAHLTLGFEPDHTGQAMVATVSLDFIRHDTTRHCIAIGERGSLRWNGLTGEVEQWQAGSLAWLPIFRHAHVRDDSYRAQWQHFLDCVALGKPPLVSGSDGLAVLWIVEAARSSSAIQGGRVFVAKTERSLVT